MSNPDAIRDQIEATRSNLSNDVNALADKVNPGHVAKRQIDKVRGVATSAKDRVMGAASDAASHAGSAGSNVSGSVTDTLTSAPQRVQSQTAGNPLAAGLIAVGVGWLVGSLLPSSRAEQQAAVSVKETAAPMVADVAKDAAQSLKQPALDAADSVKSTATDAVATVKDEGTSSVEDVKQQAVEAKDAVQETRS